MCPVSYYTMMRAKDKMFDLRLAMVKPACAMHADRPACASHADRYARAHGIRPAARAFSTTETWYESLRVVMALSRYPEPRKAKIRMETPQMHLFITRNHKAILSKTDLFVGKQFL